jgi:hypothetical protein
VFRYSKTIIFGVKGLKVVAKHCLSWISFHDDLCCCVEYSNVEDLQYLSLKVVLDQKWYDEMVAFLVLCMNSQVK